MPLAPEKRLWRRYIYLWYDYATFEEIEANDPLKAKDIYERALKLVPHKNFTFSKLWIMYAHFQIRHNNLDDVISIDLINYKLFMFRLVAYLEQL